MLRKTIFAFAAAAALGAFALAPTSASAHVLKVYPQGAWSWGWGYYPTYVTTNCYWAKKYTRLGARFVRVCEY